MEYDNQIRRTKGSRNIIKARIHLCEKEIKEREKLERIS